jgi:hypothetical protein
MWNKNAIDEQMRNVVLAPAAASAIDFNLTSTTSKHDEPLHSTRRRYDFPAAWNT